MEKVWDPLRRKDVALTPEERVRQWFISLLRDSLGVPVHQMMSEVGLQYGAGKVYRADIVVYARGGHPLAIVECKRPEVTLSQATFEQALRYDMVLGVPFIFVTNGHSTFVARRAGEGYEFLKKIPTYVEMSGYGDKGTE
ncbi:MAG: type I restriction enzyme HsdR N-terminal domain-containing protein [Bacteroidales bacterium]|nr:type I restriction enzyme HsdR N-terminal domain-containing protein [Bacteroidales bacterium]